MAGARACLKCSVVKPLESYSLTGHAGVDGIKTRRRECKDCQYKRQDASRKINRSDAKWYANNKQRVKDRVAEWRKTNMDKAYAYSARSRAKHRYGTIGYHTTEEWYALCEEFGNACAYCGTTVELTKDHVQPLSKGGTDDIDNIIPACRSCNAAKGNKTLEEWAEVMPNGEQSN